MFIRRQTKILETLETMNIDGLVLNAGASLTYFTGLHFHLMERPVILFVLNGQNPLIILPELEKEKLNHLSFELDSFTYPDNPALWPEVFTRACHRIGTRTRRMGYEPKQLRLLEYNLLTTAHRTLSFVDGDQAIAYSRSIKDSKEIEKMKKAVSIAQDALAMALVSAKIGMSEKELAAELVIQLFRHGSDQNLPFSPIVASGPNGANPHAKPSGRKLAEGDLVIIDWGATCQGYASDLTRTFAVGSVAPEYEHIHSLVHQANRAGQGKAGPGVTCQAVDLATRSVIETAGYGKFFTHRTGHGIGMECHEEPYIHDGNTQILKPGMTFTVEPGIYLKGKNGVRIEDDVVITEQGSESLSSLSRELISIDKK